MLEPDIVIDKDILSRCPECRLGWLCYTAEPVESGEAVWNHFALLLPCLQAKLQASPLADMPNLGESRRAYKACGKDPGRWRVSSEALYRRVRQGKELYRINTVVDVNNLVSLETGFSLGSYDRDMLKGSLVLRRGIRGECYAGIGKDAVDLENMPLIADGAGAVGSPSSDSTRAMVRPESRSILTLIYSFSARTELEKALERARVLFTNLAGAQNLACGIVEKRV